MRFRIGSLSHFEEAPPPLQFQLPSNSGEDEGCLHDTSGFDSLQRLFVCKELLDASAPRPYPPSQLELEVRHQLLHSLKHPGNRKGNWTQVSRLRTGSLLSIGRWGGAEVRMAEFL